jgi:hypothetical protein
MLRSQVWEGMKLTAKELRNVHSPRPPSLKKLYFLCKTSKSGSESVDSGRIVSGRTMLSIQMGC